MTGRRALSCEPSYSEVSLLRHGKHCLPLFQSLHGLLLHAVSGPALCIGPGMGWERRGVGLLQAAKTHVPVCSRQGGRTIPEVSFLTPQRRMIARIKSSLS